MLEGPEEGQLQTSDRLEAQLSLELCIEYIQVDVVILQLVEDIERGRSSPCSTLVGRGHARYS